MFQNRILRLTLLGHLVLFMNLVPYLHHAPIFGLHGHSDGDHCGSVHKHDHGDCHHPRSAVAEGWAESAVPSECSAPTACDPSKAPVNSESEETRWQRGGCCTDCGICQFFQLTSLALFEQARMEFGVLIVSVEATAQRFDSLHIIFSRVRDPPSLSVALLFA